MPKYTVVAPLSGTLIMVCPFGTNTHNGNTHDAL